MLASLSGGGEIFRVGGFCDVRGVAQFTGDLSDGECQDCLIEAISRLKNVCGTTDYIGS
uniref:Cysteine-rich repeat secretory protein 60 n=1 Tax=Cajanus cajan TaxID=3821 RepID=A0A151RH52_CAJCA|nr:Cysteine-rich repeat secretory protein 60 [Cajanus cajan]